MVESERFCARPLSRSSESPDGREFLVGRAALRASCDLRKSHLLACLLGKAWEQAVALGHRRQGDRRRPSGHARACCDATALPGRAWLWLIWLVPLHRDYDSLSEGSG